MEIIGGVVIVLAILIAVIATVLKSLIIIVPPNQVAVVSGRGKVLPDGRKVGYRTVKGGRTVRIPLIEQVDYIDLNTIPIEVSVTNAYSKGAIPLDVQGVANIKVSSVDGVLANSIERFLGQHPEYIQQIAKENLEANLRGVLSTLTPEEVNEDRLKFAQTLIDEADDDIKTLGLELDVLKIQNVTDQVGYLEAVGRRQTALVLKEARESEALRTAEAEEAEAMNRERSKLATVHADLNIAEEENKLRVRRAQLEAEASAREAEAGVAGEKARATAEQALETERIELQKRRLEADVIEPAKAKRQALQLTAQGEASKIVEDGKAQIEVFTRMAEQYRAAGSHAQEIMVLQMLPDLVEQIVDTVKGIDIDKITVIDNGNGGTGSGGGAIAGLSSQMPAAVIAITEQIETATGVNILDALVRKGDRDADADRKASSHETTARKEPARSATKPADVPKAKPAATKPAATKPAAAKPAAAPAQAPAKAAAPAQPAQPAQPAPPKPKKRQAQPPAPGQPTAFVNEIRNPNLGQPGLGDPNMG